MARTEKEQMFLELYNKANQAGHEAGIAHQPRPMIFTEADIHGNPKPDAVQYYEPEGLCGFAWVVVKPATSSFARFLLKYKMARTGYYGGLQIWISEHDQSFERKQAHAEAMAKVLVEAGYNAYADSRLD
jgi:hypothetical protein